MMRNVMIHERNATKPKRESKQRKKERRKMKNGKERKRVAGEYGNKCSVI